MGRIPEGNFDPEGAPTVVGIQSYCGPLQLRGICAFQFYRFTELLKSNPQNHHSRRVTFWPKRRFRGGAIDGEDSAKLPPATITTAPHFPNFTDLRNARETISRIATSRVSHFDRKRRFRARSGDVGTRHDFRPLQLLAIPNFSALRGF